MVFSCPSDVHETPLKYDQIQSDNPTVKERVFHWLGSIKHFLYPKDDEDIWERWWIRISQVFAFAIVVGFIILSELQITENDVLSGENAIWSFSQVRLSLCLVCSRPLTNSFRFCGWVITVRSNLPCPLSHLAHRRSLAPKEPEPDLTSPPIPSLLRPFNRPFLAPTPLKTPSFIVHLHDLSTISIHTLPDT